MTIVPAEVEPVILRHPAVHEVAIVPLPTSGWASARAPRSSPGGNAAPTLEELQGFLDAEGVAKYTWPESVEVFDEFPRTPSLKVVKRDVVRHMLERAGGHGLMTGTYLTLDLPASATPEGAGELAIAATAYVPAEVDERDLRVLVCWPGGSYGRDYWDIHLPGRDGYSFAEHMTALGFVVIAADPLGVGDSGRPEDGTLCTYDALADAAHGAVTACPRPLDRRDSGRGSAARRRCEIVGVGHSMGGGLVVLQQARWGSYDAIAVLGYTHGAKARAVPSGDDAGARATAVEQAKGFWGDQWEARYGVVDKAPHQNWLNGPDAPADIVAADNANAVVWAAEPYIDALHVGYTAAYAARVPPR